MSAWGGTRPINVDVRIVAATNRDLDEAVKAGRFREDLYHRLNVVPISLPPLRERREDIPPLALFFLARYSKEAKKAFIDITKEALEKLINYDWPGNVRELGNVIERAVVLGAGTKVTVEHLPPRIAGREPNVSTEALPYHKAINAYRRELIARALAQTQGNHAAAAKLLGLHRTHLFKLIKTLRIG